MVVNAPMNLVREGGVAAGGEADLGSQGRADETSCPIRQAFAGADRIILVGMDDYARIRGKVQKTIAYGMNSVLRSAYLRDYTVRCCHQGADH